jgi:regulatory protein
MAKVMDRRAKGTDSGGDPSPGAPRPQAAARVARKRSREPKAATHDRLEASALRYLERYAASSAHLERRLLEKVRRSAEAHGTDGEAGAAFVRALIERLRRSGLLDDRRYAEGKALTLRRRGDSARRIQAALAAKGIDREESRRALTAADEERGSEEAEIAAARRLARRRRLGPWRAQERARHRSRDLAALGRAGFSYDIARAVIDGPSEEG